MDVTESPRIDELRRRVQKDPTSIAFAQLAEEYRRLGDYQQAVNVCRAGLARHPSYLSARVTLGRALMELEEFDDARTELEAVFNLAPDNLAAIRALAEIHQRRGEFRSAFKQHTPPLETVRQETPAAPVVEAKADRPAVAEGTAGEQVGPTQQADAAPEPLPAFDALDALTLDLPPAPDFSSWTLDTNFSLPDEVAPAQQGTSVSSEALESGPVVAELERWLAAIDADRSNRH